MKAKILDQRIKAGNKFKEYGTIMISEALKTNSTLTQLNLAGDELNAVCEEDVRRKKVCRKWRWTIGSRNVE